MPAALPSTLRRTTIATGLLGALLLAVHAAPLAGQQTPASRPMTFLDMQQMRQAGSPTPSPDGKWLLYTLSTPDWKEAKRQTDIYLVSLQQGVSSTRQMTFTKEKNETSPRWARDGRFFVFLSNREAPGERGDTQPALPDAARRRRSAAHHRREGRRLGLRLQPRRHVARLPQRQGRRGTALPAAGARHPRRGDGGADHASTRPAWHLAVGARQHARSTSSRPTPSTPTRRRGARRSSPSTSATRRRRSSSLWALDARAARQDAPRGASPKDGAFSVDDVTISSGRQVGRVPRPVGESLRAQHHAGEPLPRPLPARGGDRHRSSG